MYLSTLIAGSANYQSDLNEFLRDLVRIPSVNGRDLEAALATRFEQEVRKLGLDSRRRALQSERPNILLTHGEGADWFSLIAHMDTVAEGNPASWSCPPVAVEI